MGDASRRAVQLATVGRGGGVDEKLNKIWEITKAGRERERRSGQRPLRSQLVRAVRSVVGRSCHTYSLGGMRAVCEE